MKKDQVVEQRLLPAIQQPFFFSHSILTVLLLPFYLFLLLLLLIDVVKSSSDERQTISVRDHRLHYGVLFFIYHSLLFKALSLSTGRIFF